MRKSKSNHYKKRRRINYRLLFVQLILLTILTLFIIWLVGRCSNNESNENKDNAHDNKEVVEAGKRDAEKVLEMPQGSMDRDEALLSIKAKESELRANGYDNEADTYINSVKKSLKENGHK